MKGVENEIIPLTQKAMSGEVPLDEVFGKRLAIIQPSQSDLERLGELYIETIVSGAEEIIQKIYEKGKSVGIISSGYELPLWMLAEHLDIPEENVYGNTIFFDAWGNYTGFASDNPLTKENGKVEIIKTLQEARPMLYIGDSISDLKAEPYVDLFIGYGGVTIRPQVKEKSQVYITDQSFSFLERYI